MPEPSQTDRRQVLPKERDWGKDPAVHSSPITQMGKTFDDITGVNAHKNQPAIEALAARGIIDGKSDGSFDPEGSMTRAEFAAIVVRALGLTPEGRTAFLTLQQRHGMRPMWGQPIPAALLPESQTTGSTPAARSPARRPR